MTADQVFGYARAYRLYYNGQFDFQKYKGKIKTPPLIQQRDRSLYYRVAHKLDDASIHALFTLGYFWKPNVYIGNLISDESFKAAIAFASRAQNGLKLLQADLYELRKRLKAPILQDWLFKDHPPLCLCEALDGTIPLDVACVLLLVPNDKLQFHWVKDWQPEMTLGLGVGEWIPRLQKLDQLLFYHRPGWRNMSYTLSTAFWSSFTTLHTLARPQDAPMDVLFA